jgi:ATPase subunit of ABC transporter with duplicated ATPase domains
MPEPLTPQEVFDSTEWHSRDSLVKNFPTYFQEQYAIKKATGKDVLNKSVKIENFTMKTPFGDQELLKGTDLILESNKRQGLVGANCTGKTLLFTNMSEGKIKDFPKYIHVHHCKELETHELSDTVLGTVVNSHPFRNILMKCEPKITELLNNESTPDSQKEGLKDTLLWVQQLGRQIRMYDAEERAQKMLRVLGFDEVGQKKLCSALSGGLRMRVALCMAFFIEADLLLLDEPTNHLDFPSVLWLENRLRGYKSAFLMVSHDRELLNNVCTSVLLLEDKQIKYYMMGFKEFEKKKAAEDKKKFDEIEKFLQKNVNVDPSTMLGKQKHEKKMWSDNYYQKQVALAGKFTFPSSTPLSNTEKDAEGKPLAADEISLINLQNVRFSYDVSTGHFIFNDPISFNVKASTRCGVMGPNGAGKSTLLKLLTHKLTPTEGTVVHHPKFTLAYFGQHSTAELNLEQTPIEFMCSQFPEESAGTLRQHLAKTSVVGTTADTRMHRLSFSQRSCVIFSKLTFVCPHLLIMDEPTNFLDLESVDALIAACNKYKGALLLVSHNRDFLKKCAKQYLSVVPGSFKMYDNLKDAESGTYSFIAEMEEGGKVGADALVNTPGGGSIHASQKTGAAASTSTSTTTIENGVKSITIGGGPVNMTVAPKPLTYVKDEKVQALWTDGKYYAGQIVAVEAPGKYSVKYLEYGNIEKGMTAKQLKKEAAAPAGKPGAAGKVAGGKAGKAAAAGKAR